MSFRFVPKSVTLNDLEWRNVRYVELFFYNFKPRPRCPLSDNGASFQQFAHCCRAYFEHGSAFLSL